jgi:hypothetical protein
MSAQVINKRVIKDFEPKSPQELKHAICSVITGLSWSAHIRQASESGHFLCDVLSVGPIGNTERALLICIKGVVHDHKSSRIEMVVHSACAKGLYIPEKEGALLAPLDLAVTKCISYLKRELGCKEKALTE